MSSLGLNTFAPIPHSENSATVFASKSKVKNVTDTYSKKPARRTLQVLQPAASSSSTQTLLVGGNGTPLQIISKNSFKPEIVQSEPVKAESRCETKSVEVQTEVTAASGALDHAESIAWMTTLTGDVSTMRQLAEGYSEEIQEIVAKNLELKTSNTELELENLKLREENEDLFSLVEEAKAFFDLVQPITEEPKLASAEVSADEEPEVPEEEHQD